MNLGMEMVSVLVLKNKCEKRPPGMGKILTLKQTTHRYQFEDKWFCKYDKTFQM